LAFGQTNTNSPYSRYGIGDLVTPAFSSNLGMGGIGIGLATPYNLNVTNPASYASLGLTTFEGALRGNLTSLNSSTGSSESTSSASFGYFAYGFPLKTGKWGAAFGLVPYSNVGYNISTTDNSSDAGGVIYNDKGKGGVNQFFIGTGFKMLKHLRVGVNASYLFGTITQTRSMNFTDNLNYFNTRITDSRTPGDFHFDFGLQYSLDSLKFSPSDSIVAIRNHIDFLHRQIKDMHDTLVHYEKNLSKGIDTIGAKGMISMMQDSIAHFNKQIEEQNELKNHVLRKKTKRDWTLSLGATASFTSDVKATKSSLTELFIVSPLGFVGVKDTAQYINSEKGTIVLPLTMGFGFSLKKGYNWIIGADITSQDWTTYRSFGVPDSLVGSLRYAVGAQFTPNERSLRSYWSTVQYRLGFHYTQTYVELKGTQLSDYGISWGLGLPVRRSISTLQLSFELGRMGTTANQLVEVNYFRFTLGLTLNDLWFIRPKID